MPHNTMNRRQVLQSLAGLSLAVSAPRFLPCAFGEMAPNNRLRFASIGTGGRGSYDTTVLKRFAELTAVCDLDKRRLEEAKQKLGGGTVDDYVDYRKVLDRQDIDIVFCGTPDHWHTKICLDALEAGKHLFCEKPLTLTVQESQKICEAARKSKQTMVVGTQRRIETPYFVRMANMVRQGLLGKIKRVVVSISKSYNATMAPSKDQRFPLAQVPAEFDWNTWQGQVAERAYREKRSHVFYRYWYEYAGGRVTDWGAHYLDIALWAMNLDQPGEGIVKIDPTDCLHPLPMKDGYPLEDDYYNTAHEFNIKLTASNGVPMELETRLNDGILFEGEKGRVFANCGRITGTPIEEQWDKDCFGEKEKRQLFRGRLPQSHADDFVTCIRNGELPVSDVFSHVRSLNACHVINIAARLGRTLAWDPVKETFPGEDQANSFLAREQRKGFEF